VSRNTAERQRYIEHCKARGLPLLAIRTEEYTDHLRPIVLLALNTGLRRGEIFHLRWGDINLNTKWLTVAGKTSKNKQTRQVPLNIEAMHVLECWRQQCGTVASAAYVFRGIADKPVTTITTAWRSVRARAGLEDFHFHDLRHHFASRLVQSGVDLNSVRELLGHAEITMALRYASGARWAGVGGRKDRALGSQLGQGRLRSITLSDLTNLVLVPG